MNKTLVWGSIILGIVFVILTIVYWTTPADSLPAFLPGYDPALAAVHFKHGLAAIILAAAFFIFAWFQSGPKRA